MHIAEKEIALANGRREIKEAHRNKCFYCCADFSEKPYLLTIHHQDFLGYTKLGGRDPFDRKLAKPACEQCHFEIHVAAATITLGLIKSIPAGLIRDVLIQEVGLCAEFVTRVANELRRSGISKKTIGYANNSIVYRILNHAFVNGYFDDMEQMLEEASRPIAMKAI